MTEKDLQIQDLKAENEKLKEELEQLKQPKAEVDTDMDKLTTEMMEHICDNLCKHPCNAKDQDELENICAECKMGKFVRDILNTCNHRMQQLSEVKESSLDPIEMCKVAIALDKLKEYQRLEEQGLLFKSPFKIGDTVYSITRDFISEYTVEGLRIFKDSIQYYWKCTKGIYHNVTGFSNFELGKTVFLTKQEAQAALEKIKGE